MDLDRKNNLRLKKITTLGERNGNKKLDFASQQKTIHGV